MSVTTKVTEICSAESLYYSDVQNVGEFENSTEAEHSFKMLIVCISLHRVHMSIPNVREKYRELISGAIAGKRRVTQVTKGQIQLSTGVFHFRPVQSVSDDKLKSVVYGKDLSISDLVAATFDPVCIRYSLDDVLKPYGECEVAEATTLDSLVPAEEVRVQLHSYALSQECTYNQRHKMVVLNGMASQMINKLANRNLRLVMSIVRKEYGHLNNMDAIQEGNLGLLKGIARYQPLTGFKLTTYCTHWIRKYVKSSKYTSQIVAVPHNQREAYGKVRRCLDKNSELSDGPEHAREIARLTGLKEGVVEKILSRFGASVSIEDIGEIPYCDDGLDTNDEELMKRLYLLVDQLSEEDRTAVWNYLTLTPEERKRAGMLKNVGAVRELIRRKEAVA